MRETLRNARWPVIVPVLVYLALLRTGPAQKSAIVRAAKTYGSAPNTDTAIQVHADAANAAPGDTDTGTRVVDQATAPIALVVATVALVVAAGLSKSFGATGGVIAMPDPQLADLVELVGPPDRPLDAQGDDARPLARTGAGIEPQVVTGNAAFCQYDVIVFSPPQRQPVTQLGVVGFVVLRYLLLELLELYRVDLADEFVDGPGPHV